MSERLALGLRGPGMIASGEKSMRMSPANSAAGRPRGRLTTPFGVLLAAIALSAASLLAACQRETEAAPPEVRPVRTSAADVPR
jgi:hypothetical protein